MKRSALFNQYRRHGATLTDHFGWQVPAYFKNGADEAGHVTNSAGLSDESWLLKFDLRGPGLERLPALGGSARSWTLGPRRLLVTAAPEDRIEMVQHPGVSSTEVTSVYAAFLLAGPRSRDVLRKLSSLNVSETALPDFGCGQSSLAHVHAIVLRQDLARCPAFHLLVSREYGESVWDSILHAGEEFHLTPFGLQARQVLAS